MIKCQICGEDVQIVKSENGFVASYGEVMPG